MILSSACQQWPADQPGKRRRARRQTPPATPLLGTRSRGDTFLGRATGFVWEHGGRSYLITNWHVVWCRNNDTGECLHSHGAEPDKLRARLHHRTGRFETYVIDVPLLGQNGEPLWLYHPTYRRDIDVVAIPLPEARGDFAYRPLNALGEDQLSIQIGMEVFVLGYPFDIDAEPPAFPVWKRGSIATEPQLVGMARQHLLIDTASRPGMSGAPVIRRSYAVHLMENGAPSIADAPATQFIGVYSGRRETRDKEDAQLGIVWPRQLIAEIVTAQTLDPGNRDW